MVAFYKDTALVCIFACRLSKDFEQNQATAFGICLCEQHYPVFDKES